MSSPGYGDLSANVNHDLMRVVGTCFVDLGNETPETGPADNIEIQRRSVDMKISFTCCHFVFIFR